MKRSLCVLALVWAGVGCASDQPKTAPVEGIVTYRGQPLPNGTIVFVPESGPSATGEIGPDGRYRLTTFTTGDGAVLGKHRVMVTALAEMRDRLPEDRSPLPPPLIPVRYSDFRTSRLEADVQSSSNTIDFPLQ